jgi:aspartyl-tRNA(Asn)/glutamyl-tRNA(Gln) amidotransferase subunit A
MELTSVADLIKSGEVSALEVVSHCLQAIKSRDAQLACFREVEVESALAKARIADQARSSGLSLGPLHGVPLAHKDIFYRQGQIMTAGSPILSDFVPDYDSTVISRLEHAGAITVGTLQSAEFAMSPTGYNAHIRPVRNPWNKNHSPGGSSMGSGAAVAARMVYGSMGTDTGGSVRHPCAVCGVLGVKPSQGRVSTHGVYPLAPSLDCPGILARSARDAAKILAVVAGHDAADPSSSTVKVADYESMLDGDLRNLRIGIPEDYYFDLIDDQIRECVEASLEVFKGLGVTCVPVKLINMEEVNHLARTVITREAATTHARFLVERPEDFSPQVRSRIEPGLHIDPEQYRNAIEIRERVAESFCQASLAEVDLLHIPCVPIPTPEIEAEAAASPEEALRLIDRFTRCTRGINYLGLPAISVPCGFVEHGLPAAFQLVGRPFEEGLLLKAVDAYQRETSWHRMEPG